MNIISKNSMKIAFSAALVAAMNVAVAHDNCVACHNESGISDNAEIPTIAGVGSFFLENQLAIFSEGERPCVADAFADDDADDHCAIISALSEDEKMAVAEHYGELTYESFDQEVDAGLAEQGEAIHNESCDRCHTDSGAEPFDDAGILAGQPIPYLMKQFGYYKAGDRWQPESMADVMQLDEEQMKALAHFYAGAGQ